MVNEIKIYYNRSKTKEAKNPISFEAVKAGEISTKSLFFFNNIEFPIGMGIQMVGEDIDIKKTITELNPGELKEVIFEFNPKLTIMKPIKAELIINLNYIIK
jgi:hypothetical protein